MAASKADRHAHNAKNDRGNDKGFDNFVVVVDFFKFHR